MTNFSFSGQNFILKGVSFVAVLVFVSCSSGSNTEENDEGFALTTTAEVVSTDQSSAVTLSTSPVSTIERGAVSVVVPFTSGNGSGYVTVSGDGSPVAEWFAGLPGEVSLDLVDADVGDTVSVVEELVSFRFFQDENNGDVQPSIFESASGDITDSVGTRYVVEAQGFLLAPVTETTTTTSSSSTASTTTSPAPETFKTPSVTASSTTTTSSTKTVITFTVAYSPVILEVQVLNGNGVAGAAGRMTDKLSEAGYVVLLPSETLQRYISSDVYFAEGRQAKAEDTLQAEEMGEIDQRISIPRSSLEKIKSNLLSVFDVRGFLSITTFIVCRQ